MKLTGSQLMIALLERQGITTLPGIPGGANLPLLRRAARQLDPPRPGAPRTGRGIHRPGHGARHRAPAVCSAPPARRDQPAHRDRRREARLDPARRDHRPGASHHDRHRRFQESRHLRAHACPITKHNFFVRSAAELLEVVPRAFRIAASGRPGPVRDRHPEGRAERVTSRSRRFPSPGAPIRRRCVRPRILAAPRC